jgi:hypothetical protein
MLTGETDFVRDITAVRDAAQGHVELVFLTASNSVYFNRLESGGLAMAPGLLVWENAILAEILSATESSLVVAYNMIDGPEGFAFLDHDGTILSKQEPDFLDRYYEGAVDAVPDGEGYTVFLYDWGSESGTYLERYAMQSFDGTGVPLTAATFIIEEELLNEIVPFTWAGTNYAFILPMKHGEYPYLPGMFFLETVDRSGNIIEPPTLVATGGWNVQHTKQVDITWTGSEIGMIYIEPNGPFDEPDVECSIKMARLGADGTRIGEVISIATGVELNTPALLWNGTSYGASWNEDYFTTGESQMHFAVVGCPE